MDLAHRSTIGDFSLSQDSSGHWRDATLSASFLLCALVFVLAGRDYLVLALAVLPFPYLFGKPKTAVWYALAFVPIATAVAPEAYEWFSGFTPAEMYFWALGLFVVLIPVALGVVRCLRPLTWRRIRKARIPGPLLFLFGVSLAACLQGLRLGMPLSFVVRQFYGVALFCFAFISTLLFVRRSDVLPGFRRMAILVISLCAYTAIFYFRDQNQVGFFKGNISLFSTSLAVYCGGECLGARGRRRVLWGLLGLLFLVHPILFSSRGAVGLAGISVLLGAALTARSRAAKYVMIAGSLAFFVASVTLNLFAGLSQSHYALVSQLVPSNVLADPDAIGRISQFYAAIQAIVPHPILGLGLGSTLTWYQPALGVFQSAALVDNGWAYILSKMGLLGFFAFLWFAFWIMKRVGFPRNAGQDLGIWLVAIFQLLYMVIGPIMVHFEYALWAGVTWGLLYRPHSGAFSVRQAKQISGVTQ